MPPTTRELPYAEIDLAVGRRYVQGRSDESSVRAVASAIGVAHTSLEKFLNGSTPYAKNRKLIIEWYLREHKQRPVRERMRVPPELQPGVQIRVDDGDDLEGHLDALLAGLGGEPRTEARKRIQDALRLAYRRMGKTPPRWES